MTGRQDTIAAIATPPGRGGIGVIRVSGPLSLQIAGSIATIDPKPRHAHFCDFRDRHGNKLDHGIVLYYQAPASFTGEDVIEFQGHGGSVVLSMLLKETLHLGARLAHPGEFTERAYLNDKIDLVQAEAVADLINSVSEQAARSAVRSLQGEFSARINAIVEDLISIRIFIEGALDFPEEEIDFISGSDVMQRLTGVRDKTERLLADARAGSRIREGLRVVIVGRPNVGKSSLLNRLAGEDRAIVTDVAGTTRDVIEDNICIDGVSINIVDTAGLRDPEGVVEAEGIRRSRAELVNADIVLLVTDTPAPGGDEQQLLDEYKLPAGRILVLHNKVDLYGKTFAKGEPGSGNRLYLSVKTGEGMEELRGRLRQLGGTEAGGEDTVLARERHIDAIKAAWGLLHAGMEEFNRDPQAELLAEELRNAQRCLSEITGEFHNDDLLGEIFSRFCIGK